MNGDRFYGIQKRYSLHASNRVARSCVRVRAERARTRARAHTHTHTHTHIHTHIHTLTHTHTAFIPQKREAFGAVCLT